MKSSPQSLHILIVMVFLFTAKIGSCYNCCFANENPAGQSVDTLPLIEVPSSHSNSLPVVFFISGDGGWNNFDQALSERLVSNGFSVVGLDARKYFWKAKNQKEINEMAHSVLEYYLRKWGKSRFALVGYSFGADVVPFVINNLSTELLGRLNGAFCLSPDEFADFEIHLTDMLSWGSSKDRFNVIEEVKKNKSFPIICFFGENEDPVVREKFKTINSSIVTLPGNHHYNNDYNRVANELIRYLKK